MRRLFAGLITAVLVGAGSLLVATPATAAGPPTSVAPQTCKKWGSSLTYNRGKPSIRVYCTSWGR